MHEMDWYSLVKFLHVVSAVVWVGGGLMLTMLGLRASMAGDIAATAQAMRASGEMGGRVMMPASLATFAFGFAMCWFWVGFSDLWVLIGLACYATTFLIGALVFKPAGERMAATLTRDGVSPAALAEGLRVLKVARFDYAVMLVVLADMVLKPSGSDVAILGAMAAVLAAGVFAAFGGGSRRPALVQP
jgi:uncharacterized membrane protein